MSEQVISQALASRPVESSAHRQQLLSGKRLWLAVIFGLLVFVVLLWLPFGFKTPGLMEEWMIIHDFENGGHSAQGQDVGLFVTTGDLVMRPMDTGWYIIAHVLAPDSFLGYNLLTMLTFFLRGLLLYAILRKLVPGNPLFAFGAALLFIIFPADDGLFTFRGINIHAAICLYLFAVYMLLSYYEKPHILKLVPIWLALIWSMFSYEVSYPLVAFTPFLLLWKERRLNAKQIRIAFLWWLAPLVTFTYAVVMFAHGGTYQAWVLERSGLNQGSVLGEIAQSLWMSYRRHFGEGWIPALKWETFAPLIPDVLAICATTIAALAALFPSARQVTPTGKRRYVELFLIGLAIIFLGYVVYMITPYRQLTWRVYYFSGIGGAISVACLVYFVARFFSAWRVVFAVGMCALITLAGVHALDQAQYYAGLSIEQQQLLRGVANAVPKLKAPATLVVVDETGRYRDNWTLGTSYLVEDALGYLYDDYTMKAVLCYFDPQQGHFGVLPELHEQCDFAADGLHLSEDGKLVQTNPYSDIVAVRITDTGTTLLNTIPAAYLDGTDGAGYDPVRLVDTSAAPPYRSQTLISLPN
ncbi:MAG: hypothetical protein ABI700_01405 [Chloroflexota bacterium]